MHILTCSTPIDLGKAGTLKPGRYLCEDINAFELGAMAERGTATLQAEEYAWKNKPFYGYDGNDWNGNTVLIMRSGGFGDMLLLGPVLRSIKFRWPKITVIVACRKERYAVFDGLGYPDGHIATPVSVEEAVTFDAVVSFEHVIEREKSAHYVDALARHMGLSMPDIPDSRRIEYKVSYLENMTAEIRYRRKDGKPRLGIQVMSGARYRSYPRNQTGQIAMYFLGKGWEVYLLGVKGDVQEAGKVPGLRDLTNEGLSFRQSVAAMATCDVVLAPDSSLLHCAGALGLPAVGLFAAIPSAMRTAYAPSITAIDGRGKCSPCFWHERGGIQFPKDGPCASSGRCDVLAGISVERIVAAVEAKL